MLWVLINKKLKSNNCETFHSVWNVIILHKLYSKYTREHQEESHLTQKWKETIPPPPPPQAEKNKRQKLALTRACKSIV